MSTWTFLTKNALEDKVRVNDIISEKNELSPQDKIRSSTKSAGLSALGIS